MVSSAEKLLKCSANLSHPIPSSVIDDNRERGGRGKEEEKDREGGIEKQNNNVK